jgi:hypothetical protein
MQSSDALALSVVTKTADKEKTKKTKKNNKTTKPKTLS